MGTWDKTPYGNDSASDWFAGLMDATGLRQHWVDTLRDLDVDDDPERARAAVWLFRQLGRVYVWPIADYAGDLELALSVAEQLKDNDELLEMDGMAETLEAEHAELLARKNPG